VENSGLLEGTTYHGGTRGAAILRISGFLISFTDMEFSLGEWPLSAQSFRIAASASHGRIGATPPMVRLPPSKPDWPKKDLSLSWATAV